MNTPSDKTCVMDENNPNGFDVPDIDSDFPEGGLTAWLTVFGG